MLKKKLKLYHQHLDDENKILDKKVEELTSEILYTQQISIETIADMVENYDEDTGTHVKRIEAYTKLLLKHIPSTIQYPEDFTKMIPLASLLHDIGKLLVPKEILNKPANLTPDERTIMMTHAKLGGDLLTQANEKFKNRFNKDSYLKVAATIAMYHHEKWDGTGYPEGLKGDDIPLCAAIVCMGDIYDALRSKRVYKDGFSHEKSIGIMKSESGKAFNPKHVDIFLELNEEFDDIFNNLTS